MSGNGAGTLPNFLLLGGKKCGTTALYLMLREHPEIYFAQKEIHFFSYEGRPPPAPHVVTDFGRYCELFAPGTAFPVRADASPSYLAFPGAAERIRRYLTDVQLMAILRHPVERVYSDFLHERMVGRETAPTLAEALRRDDEAGRFNYLTKSRYSRHLQTYFDLFGRDAVLVGLYDEFVCCPDDFVQGIFSFLGVDRNVSVDTSVRTISAGEPRSRALTTVLRRAGKVKALVRGVVPSATYGSLSRRVRQWNVDRPQLDPQTRQALLADFDAEVTRLEEMLGRDLSAWRS